MTMVDIHSHILPEIDDGSHSLDESIEMCRASADDGVSVMVATPHAHDGGRLVASNASKCGAGSLAAWHRWHSTSRSVPSIVCSPLGLSIRTRIFSPSDFAPLRFVSGNKARNSSPPYRKIMSERRIASLRICETCRIAMSPVGCPYVSFTTLKLSRSNIRQEKGLEYLRASAISLDSTSTLKCSSPGRRGALSRP